ncbi:hypothetical protein [Dongia deserti]|uniref:hypothetical protein n=1 Tax=Dongia deserti TaxID=2268030 RepID=UPI000E659319|nr:hypothetical protein [Dongia deserti]
MAEPRTCPVDGCETTLAEPHHILCGAHWDALSADHRVEVRRRYLAWRKDNPRFKWRTRSDFILAVNNAIKAAGRTQDKPEEMPA